ETLLEIGHRGTAARNCAFNYGTNLGYGACAQGAAAFDVGWGSVGNIPAAGAWHHFVYTYNGVTNCRFYVDGVLSVTKTLTNVLNTFVGEAILLGAQRGGTSNSPPSGYWFSGCLNSVRVHGGVLSDGDVAFNYAFGPDLPSGPISLVAQPATRTVCDRDLVILNSGGFGAAPVYYQWFRNGAAIAGATNATLILPDVAWSDHGSVFFVVASNFANGVWHTSASSNTALNVVAPATALRHRYSFTADASDSVGGAHGTLDGNATIAGGQVQLNGATGTFVNLPGGLINLPACGAVTIEAWVTLGSNGTGACLFEAGSTNGIYGQRNFYFSPHYGTNDYRLAIKDPHPIERILRAGGTLDYRTNLHIACVLDPAGGFMAFYTNGVRVLATNTLQSLTSVDTNLFFLGRSLYATNAWLNGSIDECRIYDLALSPDMIRTNYLRGPDGAIPGGPVRVTAGPQNQTVVEGQPATFNIGAIGEPPL
ncbi:MAG: LamG domain-containing protein, partial [Verrucomicrobia bacterium]|nr:LamG domain-containing protein [Verrucomicrobiota bacterium]